MILGLVAAGFAGLATMQYLSATQARRTLTLEKQKSFTEGQTSQKSSDDERYLQQNETPFRSYISPDIFGQMQVKFPKDWSGYVEQTVDGSPQINLILHPDFVKVLKGEDNPYAVHFQLLKQTYDSLTKAKEGDVKGGKLKLSTVSVSGISGSRYEGKYDSKHDGVTVLIPVRDKTVLFSTDDKKYLPEFDQILKQATVKP
ncbi:MAG TPA: hypothetical protein VLF41_01305 [Candidatus Nanoarchaeia archaeon]|nr:hypothetical protein [Candidatus Nanoarchaeia archaeon]